MKVVAVSDMHGNYNFEVPKADILIVAGDIVPLKMQRNIPQSFSWFKKKFIPWCTSQPIKHIYLVGGNHDFFLEKSPSEIKDMLVGTNITILYNEGAEYVDDNGKPWTIWGSPLCHIFGNWAFMRSDEYEKEKFSLIPNDLDILITHDAAYGRNDVILGDSPWTDGRNIGNPALAEVLKDKHPKYHFTGHLHTSDHNLVDYEGTLTACVSLLDERYEMTYKPLILEL
jgi:predicted phosphohydrolase